MLRNRLFALAGPTVTLVTLMISLPLASFAADRNWCEARGFHVNDLESHAEVKEQTLTNAAKNYINPGTSGGVSVKGWDQSNVLVRACIHAAAESLAEAKSLASQVRVAKGAGQITPEGPSTDRRRYWSVSYEIFVPRNSTNLDVTAHNGGISISDVRGDLRFHTTNGGVKLANLAGNVEGSTTNGGLNIDLSGSRWDGNGIRVTTTNGGVKLNVPSSYSARVETSTVNGGMHVDFPVTMQGEFKKNLSFDIGSGGPTIHVSTTNGGVRISRGA